MPSKLTLTSAKQRPKFLFVNKTLFSSNLSNSKDSRQVAEAIQKHVQPATRPKRKLQVSNSTHSAKRIALEGWQRRSAQVNVRVAPTVPVPPITPPPVSNIIVDEPEDDDAEETVDVDQFRRESALLTYNRVAQDVVDPFNCLACNLDASTFGVLQYHLNYSRFYLFRNEAVLNQDAYKKHDSSLFMQDFFLSALQVPMHLNSLISATAKRLLTFFPDNESYRSVAQKSTQLALRDLRVHFSTVKLDEPIDPRVVMDVLMLCMAAWFRDDMDTALVHLHALKHLINQLDVNTLDAVLLDLIRATDLFVATEAGTRPINPLTWDPTPPPQHQLQSMQDDLQCTEVKPRAKSVFNFETILTPEELLKSPVGHLPHLRRRLSDEESRYLGPGITGIEQHPGLGFTEAVQQHILNAHMVGVMRHYFPYCTVNTHAWLRGGPTKAQIRWVNTKCNALIHRLLDVGPPTPEAGVKAWISECVRLTLVMTCNYGPNPMAYRASQKLISPLQSAIVGHDNAVLSDLKTSLATGRPIHPRPLIETRLLLWSAVIGVFASHEHPVPHEWFLGRAAGLARVLGVRNYLQMHLSMGHFGHCDTLHLAAVSEVLERVVEEGRMGFERAGSEGRGEIEEVEEIEEEIRPYLI